MPGTFSGGAVWRETWEVYVEPLTITDFIAPEITPDDNHASKAITLG